MPEHSPDQEFNDDDALTLDPPGRIVVIGAGPIGLECALYARFLGYDAWVIEADKIGGSLHDIIDQPLPMMPDRCLSTLGLGAIDAQREVASPRTLPLTVQEWIDEGLAQIAASDLLADRVLVPVRCLAIDLVPVEPDDESEEVGDEASDEDEFDGEIPPDFLLTLQSETGESSTMRAECVILATGPQHQIGLSFPDDTPYFFRLGHDFDGNLESDLKRGWREIVAVFASLMGRPDLDLYRPRRI